MRVVEYVASREFSLKLDGLLLLLDGLEIWRSFSCIGLGNDSTYLKEGSYYS